MLLGVKRGKQLVGCLSFQHRQVRFHVWLSLISMGVDHASTFQNCTQAAVNGLTTYHNKFNISGYEVKELTADATC